MLLRLDENYGKRPKNLNKTCTSLSVECLSPQMCGQEELMCSRFHWSSTMICLTAESCTFTGKPEIQTGWGEQPYSIQI